MHEPDDKEDRLPLGPAMTGPGRSWPKIKFQARNDSAPELPAFFYFFFFSSSIPPIPPLLFFFDVPKQMSPVEWVQEVQGAKVVLP